MRTFIVVIALALAAPAAADPGIGARGTAIFSADRLFGLSLNEVTTEANGQEATVSRTDFSLFTGSLTNIYMTPRLAFDIAVIDGLTVGGSLGFFSGSQDFEASGMQGEGASNTLILLAPRVGWTVGFGSRAGLWLRGGFTYYRLATESANGNTTTSTSGVGLDLEPTLTIVAVQHFAFTMSILVDFPLTGELERETSVGGSTSSISADQTIRNLGVAFGICGYF